MIPLVMLPKPSSGPAVRSDGEKADSHKALDGIEGCLADVASTTGILHAGFEAGHH